MGNAAPKDLFMNFKEVTVVTDGTNATTLVEQDVDTGLTIRGGLAWLIHLVEIEFDINHIIATQFKAALSIIKGAAALPNYGDNGLISKATVNWYYATNGGGIWVNPQSFKYLPPIPIAAPNLSLYFQATVDNAAYRGKDVHARIGYTTVRLDPKTYLEIAEAWGQGT